MIELIVQNFGYAGIFITILMEVGLAPFFFLPGDTLLFASGILVEAGNLELSTIWSLTVVASILGGHLGYFVGKKIGRENIHRNKFFSINQNSLEKAERFFNKYGTYAIIFSRFVPIVRTFISPTLGILGYSKRKFFMFNILASVLWPTLLIWMGITIGKMFPNLIKYTEYIVLTALLIFLLPIILKFLQKIKS